MALKKRSKTDVSILGESLPLNNIQLYEQNNHSLRKTLEQYRKENDSLNRNNLLLSRKNDILEFLVSSISSLWDSLNADIDLYLSQRMLISKSSDVNSNSGSSKDERGNKGMFWEKMLTTKFPYVSSTVKDEDVDLDEFVYMFEGDQFLFPDDFYDEKEWEKVKKDFLDSNVGVFQCKKDALLRSVTRAKQDFKFDEAGLVKILKYNCLHYAKLFFLVYDKYKNLKSSYNSLKIELSRMTKQNAFLKFELKSRSADKSKKDSESSSSTESDDEPVKVVENVGEVTEEMVTGSALYSRLFNYAKSMDREISRLETENSELRTKISHLMEETGVQYSKIKAEFDELSAELKDKVNSFENKYLETVNEASSLQEKYKFVHQELERYKQECSKLIEELNQREVKISKLLKHNASICKSIATDSLEASNDMTAQEYLDGNATVSDSTNQVAHANISSRDVEFYKEQLLNISEELEEVSLAFEKKQKICDELMRQINELESTRQKLRKMEDAYNTLKDRFDKLVTVTNNKVATHATQCDSLEKLVESYKEAWLHSYKRASYMQHQRDVAVSAVCELQAQYRKSVRSQKSLQDYISVMKSGVHRTPSMDASLGEVENIVSQENAILRRRMICSVCSENFRDHVITKCGHVFCGVCLNNSIKTRNRKCPQCKIIFDKNDTQKIFLD